MEYIDPEAGFHIERIPEAQYQEFTYDSSIANVRTGVRAIWLLYRRGQHDMLRSLGVQPERLARLHYEGDDLLYYQERYLLRVPEVVRGAKRLVALYRARADEEDYRQVLAALVEIVVERRL